MSASAIAGYELHITKKEFFYDESGACITLQDWENYVESNTSVKRDVFNSEYNYLVNTMDEDIFPLWYSEDSCNLSTKNPSPNAIAKLIEIARDLEATVQGDDGEIYIIPALTERR
ncbi:hypothetical protein SAMN05421749_104149 [Acinetobacter marinus]|uniref:Uncharacterized protein n=1 Tax=Acinetobacter marinus TaxID=281375 RepID=A0A1G6KR75_9GAMM|nr:hypothetical protein [Acinetobacter marinus]SDC33311.1 hypothetical protein SAMN05421749_104149 [Acinetobacter marinus]